MKMETIVSSETSAVRTQTPGNYPKRNKLRGGISLHCKICIDNTKSRFIIFCIGITIFHIVNVFGLYNYNQFPKSTTQTMPHSITNHMPYIQS